MSDLSSDTPLIWTDEMIGRFWDHESKFPERYFTYQYGDQIVAELLKQQPQSERTVDFGCGAGYLIDSLLRRGVPVAGTDFSTASVDLVRSRFASETKFLGAFHVSQMEQYQGQFDAAFVIEVIEHVDESRLASTLELVRQLLIPGGIAIFSTPNEEDLAAEMVFCPGCKHTFHRWQHLRSWSPSGLTETLERAGFVVRRVYSTDFSLQKRGLFVRVGKAITRRLKGLLSDDGGYKNPHLVAIAVRPMS